MRADCGPLRRALAAAALLVALFAMTPCVDAHGFGGAAGFGYGGANSFGFNSFATPYGGCGTGAAGFGYGGAAGFGYGGGAASFGVNPFAYGGGASFRTFNNNYVPTNRGFSNRGFNRGFSNRGFNRGFSASFAFGR